MRPRLIIRSLISLLVLLPLLMHVRGDLHQGWLERLELASYDVRTWLTMPARGAFTSFSIFIDSRITNTLPAVIVCPSSTGTSTILAKLITLG